MMKMSFGLLLLLLFLSCCGSIMVAVDKKGEDIDAFEYHSPFSYDVLISDFNETDLFGRVANALECPHLKVSHKLATYPLFGKIMGQQMRQFICLPVQLKQKGSKLFNVAFLVDSGAFHVYMSNTSFITLGHDKFNLPNPSSLAYVNGMEIEVFLSHSHFENINVIGK